MIMLQPCPTSCSFSLQRTRLPVWRSAWHGVSRARPPARTRRRDGRGSPLPRYGAAGRGRGGALVASGRGRIGGAARAGEAAPPETAARIVAPPRVGRNAGRRERARPRVGGRPRDRTDRSRRRDPSALFLPLLA